MQRAQRTRGIAASTLAVALLMLAAAPAFADSGGTRVAARKDVAATPARRAPTVAIVISGDSALAGPARDALGAFARDQGFRVIQANGRSRDSAPQAYARKADAVFYLDANPIGATEVGYYGNVSTLYSAEVSLSAYRVSDGELLFEARPQSVDFTALNAREKAEEAVEPLLADVEQELRRVR
ncbi:MAG: hypothetical protein BGP24_18290 [Lysobacterales bacterium 69-70]|nr:hypothetical protein [Xanthomonadaceae bacterium]ODU32748.1 MAG: hypothetical protein ABS97_14600 [Xanthomonadaceae bacterium SCN 69-320]ODV15671.1 MAG: hypothetical protein ABT27_22195 [Xanthomonadaceae bacterium SCN 69-25]OJY99878.1 MAG: hypothetical protein BGP24_18290 [Xanthomonadales bacterium 69-70]